MIKTITLGDIYTGLFSPPIDKAVNLINFLAKNKGKIKIIAITEVDGVYTTPHFTVIYEEVKQ